ncbi:hypothetical protein BOO69_10610 [Sulfitobacter alexandrii]|uniref:Phage tail assembly chaperone n=1 Tax=Sulfitobacter alexandrii TaxID=1917485 RepID=A0A1J0WI51_9RHOB|nr:rcc01693 family protein [Sulfitobacter alexandrii]APE43814.1 hypothetical protein BOO69_10610 [Sulfitobacter alexandrii]
MSVQRGLGWAELMRAGLHGLRLAPETFWALTPAELRIMLGCEGRQAPMLSDGLAALMAAYPDQKEESGNA